MVIILCANTVTTGQLKGERSKFGQLVIQSAENSRTDLSICKCRHDIPVALADRSRWTGHVLQAFWNTAAVSSMIKDTENSSFCTMRGSAYARNGTCLRQLQRYRNTERGSPAAGFVQWGSYFQVDVPSTALILWSTRNNSQKSHCELIKIQRRLSWVSFLKAKRKFVQRKYYSTILF